MHARPLPQLQDERQSIRLATAADVPAVVDFFVRNRVHVQAVEPRRPEAFYTRPFWEMRQALNLNQYQEGRNACLFVFDHASQQVIGDINFTQISGYPLHGCTLGYALDAAHWGQGRMHSALQLAITWAVEAFNLHRIAANHLPDNLRSARLLRKLGFVAEGFAPDYLLIDGRWQGCVLTSWRNPDWQARDYTAPLVLGGDGRPTSPA